MTSSTTTQLTHLGLDLTIEYSYVPGHDGSLWEPPCQDELEILNIQGGLVTDDELPSLEAKLMDHVLANKMEAVLDMLDAYSVQVW